MQVTTIRNRVFFAWCITLCAMLLAVSLGSYAESKGFMTKHSVQALVFSTLIVLSFGYVRTKLDHFQPKGIGVNRFKKAMKCFLLGLSIFLVPLLITLMVIYSNKWATIHLNILNNTSMVTGLFTVFLFEAFPEEYVFRGYIYSNLNVVFQNWKAALLTVFLFVLFPIVLHFLAQNLMGLEADIGGQNSITGSYLITLLLFGCFTIYLRILTRSIWTSVGFHLFFVYVNRLMGPDSDSFIQLSNVVNPSLIQQVYIISLLTVFFAMVFYPMVSKHKVDWKTRNG